MKRLKMKLVLVAIMSMVCVKVSAYDAEIDGVYYNFSETEATVVKGIYEGEITIPESVSYGGKIYPVTAIGENAFNNCYDITAVSIGNSVTSIGAYAFESCPKLSTINIPANVASIGFNAFAYCTGLTSVILHCKEIGSWFSDNRNIKEVIIGEEVTSIGKGAFWCCTGLTTVNIPDNVKTIGNQAFQSTGLTAISIGNGLTSIGDEAFQGCTGLTSVELPNSVASIGQSAFGGCSALLSVTVSENASEPSTELLDGISSSLGKSAFTGCTVLTNVSIPKGVTSIDNNAFQSCRSLTSVNILGRLTSIGNEAFSNCNNLVSVSIPNGAIVSIGDDAFWCCVALTSINCPNTNNGSDEMSFIGKRAFSECQALTSINIPNSVTHIGEMAFYNCKALTQITLPEGLQTIGNEAFRNMGLTTLTIPSTVKEIGNMALTGKFIYCNPPTPPAAISSLTYNASNTILYVPQGSGKAYSNAEYWKEFFIVDTGKQDWADGSVTVTVETPGQLRMSIVELDEDQITRLVVKGSINSADLKYLIELTGKLSELESLDLCDVTLVCDDGCYYTKYIPVTLTEGIFYYYYLSAKEYEEHWSGVPGNGGTNYHQAYYGNQLAGAFQSLPLKHIVMPKSVTKVARETFLDCSSLQEVEYPGGIRQVEDMAFSGCSRLRSFDVGQSDSIGVSAFYNCGILEEIEGLEYVKYIGKNAFSGCAAVKGNASGVLALDQVDAILEQAFYGCTMLSNVRLSDRLYSLGQKAFSGCKSLTAIQIPESLKALPAGVFADCSSLQQVTYSSNLLQVDAESFTNSAWMELLPVENGIKYMGHIALCYDTESGVAATSPATLTFREGTTSISDHFINTVYYSHKNNITAMSFPSTLLRIGDGAFMGNTLATLSLPDGLEEIGESAFAQSSSLTKVTLSENLKRIGDGAFTQCSKLAQVVFNARNVECSNLFAGCSSLEKVTIGAKVQRLPEGIFYNCANLLIVQSDERTDDTPLEIGASAFYNCTDMTKLQLPANTSAIGAEAFGRCTSLTSFEIPQRVTTINKGAFEYCTGLTSVLLHENVRAIGDQAFYGCKGISAFIIPQSLDSIGTEAFRGCYQLTELTIPASVKHIGNNFIGDCYNLTTLTSYVSTPQALSDIVYLSNEVLAEVYGYYYNFEFYRDMHYDEMTLYVPDGCKSRYQNTSGWSKFKHIEEFSGGDVTALNKVTATNVTIAKGMTATLPIGLQNVIDDFTAYQFDLVLPRGIEICTDGQGNYEVTKGDRYTDAGQVLMAEKVLDNPYLSTVTYRIICMSMSNAVITGTDGTLLTIRLRCLVDKAEGNYDAVIENVTFTQVDGTKSNLDQQKLTITVTEPSGYEMGDVNGDGVINVSDVVAIVNYIVGIPNTSFVKGAADLNGDGVINVTDAVRIITMIMEGGNAHSVESIKAYLEKNGFEFYY